MSHTELLQCEGGGELVLSGAAAAVVVEVVAQACVWGKRRALTPPHSSLHPPSSPSFLCMHLNSSFFLLHPRFPFSYYLRIWHKNSSHSLGTKMTLLQKFPCWAKRRGSTWAQFTRILKPNWFPLLEHSAHKVKRSPFLAPNCRLNVWERSTARSCTKLHITGCSPIWLKKRNSLDFSQQSCNEPSQIETTEYLTIYEYSADIHIEYWSSEASHIVGW